MLVRFYLNGLWWGGVGGVIPWVLGSRFAGYVPLTSQKPYPIIVYLAANYKIYISYFWAGTECNGSRLLNIKTASLNTK